MPRGDVGDPTGWRATLNARPQLALAVKAAVERDPVDLIEKLADRIAAVCLTDHRVDWCRVTVHKPDAPIEATFTDVALTITRKAASP